MGKHSKISELLQCSAQAHVHDGPYALKLMALEHRSVIQSRRARTRPSAALIIMRLKRSAA
jgi:hypothetical protein